MTCWRLIVLLLIGVLTSQGCDKQAGAKADIRNAYLQYADAIKSRNGAILLEHVDPESILIYDTLLKAALRADRAKTLAMRPSEKLEIVAMRNRLTRDELKNLDARAYVILAVERGFWNFEAVRENIQRIKITGNRAVGELFANGEPTGERFRFTKIGERWFIDETSFLDLADEWIPRVAGMEGLSVDEWIVQYEAEETKKDVTGAIWDPPPSRKKTDG